MYDAADYIEKMIDSVRKQSYIHWELIIVDDCSSDNSVGIVCDIQKLDSRIVLIENKENLGAARSRNAAMNLAKGRYIAFLDSDDFWMPFKLERQLIFMESNKYEFSCTDYAQVDSMGRDLGKVISCKKRANYNAILLSCPVGNSTVIFDRIILGDFIIPNIRKRNDDALWLQILKKTSYIYGLNEVLSCYRVRENSISSNKFDLIKYHWKLYREIENLSVLRSGFHIIAWIFIKVLGLK